MPPPVVASSNPANVLLSRAQRAHTRLSWAERLARNVRVPDAAPSTIMLFGVPEHLSAVLGLHELHRMQKPQEPAALAPPHSCPKGEVRG
jgi:hypothetical protein